MLNDSVLKISPHGSFKVTQLCESVAICEAMKGDRHRWGNGTDDEPAFVAYLGCSRDEVEGYIKTFQTFYRCYIHEIRKPKYLKDFEVEIKIYAMQRHSDSHAMGLNYLVESHFLALWARLKTCFGFNYFSFPRLTSIQLFCRAILSAVVVRFVSR